MRATTSLERMMQTQQTHEQFSGPQAIRARLAVGEATFRLWRKKGLFPEPDVTIGVVPRWKESTIQAFIDQGGTRG